MPHKRSHSLDMNDASDDCSKNSNEQFNRVSKKGKRGRGGAASLSQPVTLSTDSVGVLITKSHTSSSTAPSEHCVMCDSISTTESSIQCDTCGHFYHLECCLVKEADVATVRMVIALLGWSCRACRTDLGRELTKLKNDVTELQSKNTANKNMKQSTVTTVTQQTSVDTQDPVAGVNLTNINHHRGSQSKIAAPISFADVVQIVTKSVRDVTVRKRNIIVTGLLEQEGWDDGELFSVFCEEQLSTKPRISPAGTRRLGRNAGDKPRRLLVHLESEAAVSELLVNSRHLRESDDEYVARNVYINADLTKEEAKLAYERRQDRRGRQATDGNHAPQRRDSHQIHQHQASSRPARNANRNFVFHNTNRSRPAIISSNPSNLIDCSTATTTFQFNTDFPALSSVVQTANCSNEPITNSIPVLNTQALSYQPAIITTALQTD